MKDTHFVNPTGAENKQLKDFCTKKYKMKRIIHQQLKILQF